MKKIALFTFALILATTTSWAGQVVIETGTMPPAGSAALLRLEPTASLPSPCRYGMLGVTNTYQLQLCGDVAGSPTWLGSSPFLKSGNNIYNATTSPTEFLGLGVDNPEFKLHLGADGGILATGTLGSGTTLTTGGAGTRLFWYPRKSSLRVGTVSSTQWDDANIGNYSIGLGHDALAPATASSVLGGSTNTVDATAHYSTINGGLNNTINDANTPLVGYSVIGGGRDNALDGSYEVIGGGYQNFIGVGTAYHVIGGGYNNRIPFNTTANTISGGRNNSANGLAGVTVAGGDDNDIDGGFGYATVSGGLNNDIVAGDSSYSTIGGGNSNTVRLQYSVISGGSLNNIDATIATIGGGALNSITGGIGSIHGTIGGGSQNLVTSNNLAEGGTTVAGGVNNTASDDYAFVGGGRDNVASGHASVIAGGGGFDGTGPTSYGNLASSAGTFIGGGRSNVTSAVRAVVTGGEGNTASGSYSVISGGFNNDATNNKSTVGGGENNTASGVDATVIGGIGNTASGTGSIVGGSASTAAGNYGVALGQGNHASAANSVALGVNMNVEGAGSFGFGNGDTVSEEDVFVITTPKTGIGTTTPLDGYVAHLAGDVYVEGFVLADGGHLDSDARFKENIQPLSNSLDKIAKINGVSYEWNELKERKRERIPHDIGILAQDVEKVFPELVHENRDGHKSVDYTRLIAPLIEAVKELNNKIENLEEENKELRNALDAIHGID